MRNKILLAILVIALTPAALAQGYAVSEVNIDVPNEHPVDQDLTINGDASGYNLDYLAIYKKVSQDGFERIGWTNCDGQSSCDVSVDYTPEDTGTEAFEARAWAGSLDGESREAEVNFVDTEDSGGGTTPPDTNEAPNARLDVEKVSRTEFRFDGTGSYDNDGNIESYFFRFDGGSYTEDSNGVRTKSFSEGEHTVNLRVVDNDGADDTISNTFTVERTAGDTCNLDVSSLTIDDDSIESEQSTDVSLDVDNEGTEGQDVRVRFYADGDRIETENSYLSNGETDEFTATVSGSDDTDDDNDILVKAVVTVTDGSCEDEGFKSTRTGTIGVFDGGDAGNDDDSGTLEAKFDVSDRYPDIDQEVTFDAKDSTGDIIDYRWIFGDGEEGSGIEDSHSYDESGNYEAKLIVEDSEGNRDTARKTLVVEDVDQDRCELNVGSLNLNPDEVEEGDSSTASVVVTNTGERGQDVFVKFYSSEGTYETYSEFFTVGESERFTAEVAEDEDTLIRAKVVANSDDCEEFTYERSNMLFVVGDRDRDIDEEQAYLTVKVKDEDNDPVYGALVEVENSDYEDDITSSDGESEFSLDPDSYDITVSKDGYETEYRSVNLDEGESDTVYVTLEDDDDFRDPDDDDDIERGVKIRDVDYPSRVCEGSSFTASVRVRNEGDFHEVITLTGSGLGSITTGQSTSVEEGDSKTINLRFTNVEGSGNEQFKLTLTNHNDDRVYRTINVDTSCYGGDSGYNPGTTVTDSPDSITLEVSPQRTTIGNSVLAKGFVHGARGRQTVEITIDGQRKARVTTQPDGYYQVYLTPSKIGSQNVRASTGRVSANREIEMIPTASVLAVKAPEKQFVGDSFEVCGDVESPATPRVYLLKDGRVVDFKSGSGKVCFDVEAQEEGTHRFEIRALSYGQVSSSFTTTQVLPVGSEVENFPDKVAMVESEEGMVKVRLYNQHDEVKRYNVKLEGLPSTWSSQSEKEVLLAKGERSNVYFYLTPREVGRYDPTVVVESDNEKIFETGIVMEAGGTKTVRNKSFFERMAEFFRL